MQQASTHSHVEEYGAKNKKLRERIQELNESDRANHQAAADILQVIHRLGEQRSPDDIAEAAKIAAQEYNEAVKR